MTDIFQQIRIATELEAAAISTLSAWWYTYSREIEIQGGMAQDSLPQPKSFLTADRVDRSAGDQMPSIVVVSPGLAAIKPKREGDGTYSAYFMLGVGVFVSARDRASTSDLLRTYIGIARSIMIQKPSLGGHVSALDWLDESYDDAFQFTDQQTIGAGQLVFQALVDGVINKYGGPQGDPMPAPDPDNQPGSTWPTVQTVTATVEVKED